MKTSIRRELAWICLPLVLLMGAGAWISHEQNERNARQRQRENGPLRVRVWGIYNMGVYDGERAAGYDYGFRVDAHIEGRDNVTLAPGEVWMLRVKSAQIVAGQTSKKAHLVSVMSPVVYENGEKQIAPSADVLEFTEVNSKPREANLWLYCDSALPNPTLQVQFEIVSGKVVPVVGSLYKKKFVTSGRRIVAPIEKIPLRVWDENNSGVVKSEY